MATPRKHWFKVADSVLWDGLTDAELATMVRLAAYLNTRWARDGLLPDEACNATLAPGAWAAVTGSKRIDSAEIRLSKLAAKSSLTVAKEGDNLLVSWPKFATFQGYATRESPESRPGASPSGSDSGTLPQEEEQEAQQREEQEEEEPRAHQDAKRLEPAHADHDQEPQTDHRRGDDDDRNDCNHDDNRDVGSAHDVHRVHDDDDSDQLVRLFAEALRRYTDDAGPATDSDRRRWRLDAEALLKQYGHDAVYGMCRWLFGETPEGRWWKPRVTSLAKLRRFWHSMKTQLDNPGRAKRRSDPGPNYRPAYSAPFWSERGLQRGEW
jgi:hypothetical protein